jgi:hypothetical protein
MEMLTLNAKGEALSTTCMSPPHDISPFFALLIPALF